MKRSRFQGPIIAISEGDGIPCTFDSLQLHGVGARASEHVSSTHVVLASGSLLLLLPGLPAGARRRGERGGLINTTNNTTAKETRRPCARVVYIVRLSATWTLLFIALGVGVHRQELARGSCATKDLFFLHSFISFSDEPCMHGSIVSYNNI